MKLVKMGVALIVAISSFGALQAQTADEIVAKYVSAIGGKDKLDKVKTFYSESTSQVMGNEGPSVLTIVRGTGYKVSSETNGQAFVMVLTDKGGWQINPFSGAATATALPEEAVKQGQGRLDPFGPLFDYAAKGNKVELVGKDAGAYKLKVTNAVSGETLVYIDSATYYMTKLIINSQFMGQTMDVITTYSDFKKGDMDIVFPYNVVLSYGGQFEVTNKVNKIEINKTIDPAVFEMPKS
jgi:outer membrane lipoprotein-sorting protein